MYMLKDSLIKNMFEEHINFYINFPYNTAVFTIGCIGMLRYYFNMENDGE